MLTFEKEILIMQSGNTSADNFLLGLDSMSYEDHKGFVDMFINDTKSFINKCNPEQFLNIRNSYDGDENLFDFF